MTGPNRLRWLWIVLLVLLVGLLVWLRLSGLLERYFEPWGAAALRILLLAFAGQASGRVLRSRQSDTLPLWLAALALGGVAAAFLAQPTEALGTVLAMAGWASGLGLAGFPIGFDV